MSSFSLKAYVVAAGLLAGLAPLTSSALETTYSYKVFKKNLMAGQGASAVPESIGGDTGDALVPEDLFLSTTFIDFGDVATNTTETGQVLVSNFGTGTLTFTAVPKVSGDAELAAGKTTCGATLSAGTDCLVDATFSPTSEGTFNGVLTLTSNLANSPHEVLLTGNAFNPVSLPSSTLPMGYVGKAYSYDFKQLLTVSNETNPDKSKITWTGSGTLPSNLSFNTATGELYGTPTTPTTGASYTVTGTYKNNKGQQVFNIVVGEASFEVIQIDAGRNHACALTTAGGVKCWGMNARGQLGNGTQPDSLVPVTVIGLASGVASISATANSTCAVTIAGAAKCWGAGDHGQLGDGAQSDSASPVDVVGLSSGVAAISVGDGHTCALTTAGGVKCWGNNGLGQIGDGTTTSPRLSPTNVVGLSSGVSKLSVGSIHSCALTSSGGVKCWGANMNYEMGDGVTAGYRARPVDVANLSNVVQLSAGMNFTCAVTLAGGAKCWGQNTEGKLGKGSTSGATRPVDVLGLTSGVKDISAGSSHACAITTSGGVKCWGANPSGFLGVGSATNPQLTPADVVGLSSGGASMTSGFNFSCVLTSTGIAKCWGDGIYGKLGNGSITNRTTPTNVSPG